MIRKAKMNAYLNVVAVSSRDITDHEMAQLILDFEQEVNMLITNNFKNAGPDDVLCSFRLHIEESVDEKIE